MLQAIAYNPVKIFLMVMLITSVRYVVLAGPAYLVFYRFFRDKFEHLRIQKRYPANKDLLREFGWSISTFAIFGTVAAINFHPSIISHSQWYFGNAYGIWYMLLSIVLALFIHDLYFYITHRIMHGKWLFRVMHRTHHVSTNPSPWAAFAFHPLEAVVEAGIVPLLTFVLPMNGISLMVFLVFMTVFNVIGHLGYEVFPHWLTSSWAGRWLNTSTNHNMHHRYFTGNYGLYTRIWDEVFDTTNPDYEDRLLQMQGHNAHGALVD